ncbi:MAG TPA: putative baseplate assembly protein [Burkholderiaceae bacterium]|nr:putative baseplate assembly protein [Burkholderiaceae bacterium]
MKATLTGSPVLCCASDAERRRAVRASALNGLDYLEVDAAQTTLRVYFLGHAPEWISAEHLRIEGGRRVRGIVVTGLRIERSEDDGLDDCMIVSVDRAGDFSSYRLSVVAIDEAGKPTGRTPAGFDPRYVALDFSFKASCPSDLDCIGVCDSDETLPDEPVIDYLAKDYASFRRLLLDRLALLLPGWKERHVPDIGMTLVELLAYAGDYLSYQQDAVATEAYLGTARLRVSVRRHARLVDYLLHEGCNARAWVVFDVADEHIELRAEDFYITPRHTQAAAPMLRQSDLPGDEPRPYLGFQAKLPAGQTSAVLRSARNRIGFYTWGQAHCCLERGATSATLVDPGRLPPAPDPDNGEHCADSGEESPDIQAAVDSGRWHELALQPCDVLVFEEVLGPRTGHPADANPAHRHAVRLTHATPTYDPLTRRLLYEVEWCAEDALPFALCLSSRSDAPACHDLSDVSIAWGNVLLVDHGLNQHCDLDPVPEVDAAPVCEDACHATVITRRPGRYRPRLPLPEPTYATPITACSTLPSTRCCAGCGDEAAGALLTQDVLAVLPEVTLQSQPQDARPGDAPHHWLPRLDLLDSGPDDRHFVVEVDDDRVAWLRFGDGDCGRAPEAGERFSAHYRVGNGTAGMVGADTLVQIVFRDAFPGGSRLLLRNPMAAAGGVAPEDVALAKLRAPHAFERRLERAITADDYAAIVMRDFASAVQRAAAVLRPSGAVVDVQVVIDAAGSGEPDAALMRCIEAHLQRYRRIGHHVHVTPAEQVPLDVTLHICVEPGYLRGHVKAALQQVLGAGRWRGPAPAGAAKPGFFNPDALKLGEPVLASRLVAAAQAVDGVAGVVLERFERLYEGSDGEIANGILPIGPLEVARLDNDPAAPENGRLMLALEGGR